MNSFIFACIIPSPTLAILSAKRELPREWSKRQASPAFGASHKERTSVSPHPETGKAEIIENARDNKDEQGGLYQPHSRSHEGSQ